MLSTPPKKKSNFPFLISVKFVYRLAKSEVDRIPKKEVSKKTTTVVVSAVTTKGKHESTVQRVLRANSFLLSD